MVTAAVAIPSVTVAPLTGPALKATVNVSFNSCTKSSVMPTTNVLSAASPLPHTSAGRTVTAPTNAPNVTGDPLLSTWNVLPAAPAATTYPTVFSVTPPSVPAPSNTTMFPATSPCAAAVVNVSASPPTALTVTAALAIPV